MVEMSPLLKSREYLLETTEATGSLENANIYVSIVGKGSWEGKRSSRHPRKLALVNTRITTQEDIPFLRKTNVSDYENGNANCSVLGSSRPQASDHLV